jgi:putative endonuclease
MTEKQPCIYILTNKPNGVLYIGMSAYLAARIEQHLTTEQKTFASRYNLHSLVHVEFYNIIEEAAAREQQLKHWKREWKVNLIEENNPEWIDLKSRLVA